MRRLQKRAGGNHVHLARNTRCIGDPIEAAYAEITRAALRGKQANFGHIDSARFGRESISVFAFADVAIILGRGELHNPIVAIDAGQHFRSRPTQRAAHREQCVKILGAVSSEHARAFSSQLIEVRRSRRTRQRYLRNIFECAHAVEPHDGKPGDGTHGERIDAVRSKQPIDQQTPPSVGQAVVKHAEHAVERMSPRN